MAAIVGRVPMSQHKYDLEIDLSVLSNHTLMIEMIGFNKRVLEVGCATGYMSRVLSERGCRVTGIEIDAAAAGKARPHCEEVIVADVEGLDLPQALGTGAFDVVVFGDVLEHLRDPLTTLRNARPLLVPEGYVVASIPNIAHGSVRLSLLQGRFEYRPLGLLDDTHIRFFTRESIGDLFRQAGFALVEVKRVTVGFFDTEIPVRPEEIPAEVIREIESDPEATTYQFVVKALVDNGLQAVRELHAREEAQRAELLDRRRQAEALEQGWKARAEALEQDRDRWRGQAEALEQDRERWRGQAEALEQDRERWRGRALDAERRYREREPALRELRAEADSLGSEIRALSSDRDEWRRQAERLAAPPTGGRQTDRRRARALASRTARAVWRLVPEPGKRVARPAVHRLRARLAPYPAPEPPAEPAAGPEPRPDSPAAPSGAAVRRVKDPVSVLIPTLDAGPEFARALDLILSQEGVDSVELVVADSGSSDQTLEIARSRGARILEIPRAEFNHGGTRNRMAEAATGEVLLMTVQDAFLAGRHAVRDLVLALRRDPQLAAVYARQIPRSGSDLFGAFLTTAHQRVMAGHRRDLPPRRFQAMTLIERRAACAVDNVCAAIDRRAWEALRFRDMSFGEDLDFGIRAAEQGWLTAPCESAVVAHSHDRSAVYHLRRFVVDRLCIATLLGDPDMNAAAASGLDSVAAAARLLLGEVEAAAALAAGDTAQVALDAYLLRAAEILGGPPPPVAPSGELAEVDELLRGEAGRAPAPDALAELRRGLIEFLRLDLLLDYAGAHARVPREEAGVFLARSVSTVIGPVLGDALRDSTSSSPLALRLTAGI